MTGMEPFVDPLAGGLVGIVFDTAKKVGGGFAQAVGDRRQAAQALKRYEKKYRARYGTLKLLGMQKSVDLETVYTKVRFLDELSIRQFASLEDLEHSYRQDQQRRFQVRQLTRLDGAVVANENQYLMVLGGPGAGKSTYLRRVGLEALKGERGNYKHRCIPVMLELKQFNSGTVDLTKAIASEFANFGFPDSPEFAINALEQGKLLILLDGLDEVPKVHLNAVVDSIQNFITRYDQNYYISSCRIAAHRSTWNRFRDIELADFDDEQIRQFIQSWFSSELDAKTKTAERCWIVLNENSNSAAKELAQTPLLLTFLCLVYNRTQSFPANRANLYRKALDILLEEWAAEKRITPGEVYQGLNTDLEKILLSEIAYNGFINDQLFFTQAELIDQIKGFLSDTVDKPKYLDGKAVLDAIAIQQGILVERAEDIYSFSHLTLQEYLTAHYISQEPESIKELVKQYSAEQRWREVFLLVAGSLRNTDKLLELMEETAKECLYTPNLRALLAWASRMTNASKGSFKPSIKRIVALSIALSLDPDPGRANSVYLSQQESEYLSTQGYDLSHKFDPVRSSALNAVLERAKSLARTIDKSFDDHFDRMFTLFYGITDSSEMRQIFLKELDQLEIFNTKILLGTRMFDYQVWLNAFRLFREWTNISSDELDALECYLYVNELILCCKEAAVRVSEKFWQGAEERMITSSIDDDAAS